MSHFLLIVFCFLVSSSFESIIEHSSDKSMFFPRMKIPPELMTGIINQLTNQTSSLVEDQSSSLDRLNNDSVCGKGNVPSSKESRILGGSETGTHEFPWQAFLIMDLLDGNREACGGSLIGDQWILTAAHCVYQAQNVHVYLGAHNVSDLLAGLNILETDSRKSYNSTTFYVHPDWLTDPNELFSADLALVQLPTRIPFSDFIRPVYLPSFVDGNHVNDPVTIIGWGLTSGNATQQSSVLLKTTANVVSNSVCVNVFGDYINITQDMICISGANDHGVCNGDSGGPMNYQNQDGTWTEIGLVSFGVPGCPLGQPDVFTRVHSFLSWINETTAGNFCSYEGNETSTIEPSTDKPSTIEPTTDEPSTNEPSTNEPSTNKPSTNASLTIHSVQHFLVIFLLSIGLIHLCG